MDPFKLEAATRRSGDVEVLELNIVLPEEPTPTGYGPSSHTSAAPAAPV